MNKITTTDMTIYPDMCQRLDKAIYGNAPAPERAVKLAQVYRSELVEYISRYNPVFADRVKNDGLYSIYCWAVRIAQDWAKHDSERRSANIETAHNQLKNWK